MIRLARLIINKKIHKGTIGFPDFQSNRQLIVASRPPAASEYILRKKKGGKKTPQLGNIGPRHEYAGTQYQQCHY